MEKLKKLRTIVENSTYKSKWIKNNAIPIHKHEYYCELAIIHHELALIDHEGRYHDIHDNVRMPLDLLIKLAENYDRGTEILTCQHNNEYIQFCKYGDNDYSVWFTHDIDNDNSGTSVRGTLADIFEEILNYIQCASLRF